ncbi:RPE-retinal G protein-coupled receptor-like [Brienomyrus brachyistius]|uniref:RPE-retinal G protein-coupled receptor-like n=1 Tax=Brienomyrus brachyistius TaxID=42636 RepID=UPI0020B43443|nr:RPE-retinal G protein-coupled receptor-like [Brienomyrus brachyistius]
MVTSPEGFSDLDVFSIGGILFLEGLVGFSLNALTLVSFFKIRQLRTPSNFLVFSLAMADIGICINATVAAFSSFLGYWPYGSEGCQTHGFQGFLTALASINFIAAIAWDRYHQYCTRTKLQWSHVIPLVLFIWCFTGFWSAMPLLGWGEYAYEPLRTCCTLDYSKGDRNYVSYMLPMAVCNLFIQAVTVMSSYQSIERKFKKTGQYKFNPGTPLKTLLFCWAPYAMLSLYAVFEDATLVSPRLRMVPPLLAKTSPTFNAYLYAFGNEHYRWGIWQLLNGHKSENR